MQKPSDPHCATQNEEDFNLGMVHAFAGARRVNQRPFYLRGYKHGLAVLEKERAMKAKEAKAKCPSTAA